MKIALLWICILTPATIAHYSKRGLNGSCPRLDDEVCGTNNITYQNECFLQQAGASKAYDGWCINGQNASTPASGTSSSVISPQSHFVPISGSPAPPPQTHIEQAVGGSQLIIQQWYRNEHNGYLAVGERYVGCPCNDSLLPVCGANGMTYSNMCRAECANIKAVKYGECGDYNYVWPGPNSCLCPFQIDTKNAVCGVNNRTYESECVSKCSNTPVKGGGFCKNKCNCDHYFKPVCGRDGATYDNLCKLHCLGLDLLHDGICSKSSVDTCYFCEGNIKRVCGIDGKTYDNECFLKCRGTQKVSDGACPKKKGEKCNCPDVELPVCGIDEVTYKNICELECKGIPKLANKPCYLYKREQNSCKNKCKNEAYKPVCASNGQTYNNRCSASCGGLSITANGPCGSSKGSSHCVCSDEPMPVCGVDGRDYLNKCAIECAGVSIAWEGPCNMHKSQSGALYKTGQISPGGPFVDRNMNHVNPGPPLAASAPRVPSYPQNKVHTHPFSGSSVIANIAQSANMQVNNLAPNFHEIKQIIDLKLSKQPVNNNNTIVILPPIEKKPVSDKPIEITLQFVNPDGTKTDIKNEKISKHSLTKNDFIDKSGSGDPFKMSLKMDRNISLKKLYSMISLNPKSFYNYFSGLIQKGMVSKNSIMFKGLTLGKMMDYIQKKFQSNDLMVGTSKH